LSVEFALVSSLVSDYVKENWRGYPELDLNHTEPGRQILAADAAQKTRLVLAFVAHAAYYDRLVKRVKALAATEMERINWHVTCPEWKHVWPPRQVSSQALNRLLRQKLPLASDHLLHLATWMVDAEPLYDGFYPIKAFVKALENHGEISPDDRPLRDVLTRLGQMLKTSQWKQHPKFARQIELVLEQHSLPTDEVVAEARPKPRFDGPDPAQPAPVGDAHILVQLKTFLGMAPEAALTGTQDIGFDHFPLRSDSPLAAEHELISRLLTQLVERPGYHEPVLGRTEAGQVMLARDARGRARLLLSLAERCANIHFVPGGELGDHRCWQAQGVLNGVFKNFLGPGMQFNRTESFDLLLFLSALGGYQFSQIAGVIARAIPTVEKLVAQVPLTAGEKHVLHRLRCRLVRTCPFGRPPPEIPPLDQLIGDDLFIALVPGEAWSDAVNAELGRMDPKHRSLWLELLAHTATATGSRPSAKWLKTAKACLAKIGEMRFAAALLRWYPLVNASRTIRLINSNSWSKTDANGMIDEENALCLRGLLWMSPAVASHELVSTIGTLTVSCYRKIPGVGPRAVKVGNAGVFALGEINDPLAVGQLAILKVKVKFGSAQKEIEKAFVAAAERSALPREELEEMAIPTYGLTEVGRCEEPIGEFTARLSVTGTTSTELVWVRADGQIQTDIPASIKTNCKTELKELQLAAKDLQSMLPAQRARIDSLFLEQKTWPLPVWRERYLNHPLTGTLARRILWQFKCGTRLVTALWFNGALVDLDLQPVTFPDEATIVELWHPIGRSPEEVVAWRSWLDAQQIQQPFKQAHREIYVLTDAERQTRIYSNRQAAHVLKQHQFNALCALRGWKNKLRLLVDAEYPPATLHLPKWGLRAEFWVEGLGADYGTDTNDSGVYHYLSTDQVRFYRTDAPQQMAHAGGGGYHPEWRANDAEPVPLSEVPPLVFSEVMRDVDFFVGVASLGNDPAWSDGGPEGRYQAYWRDYAFGSLNASATTRQEVLHRLVPRLKIAGRCSFQDKFLVVKGSLRTYKIHLGSGNILMEPNDQYLCIVPRQGAGEKGNDPVLLPFEGDRTLSVILSKAFLLAEDHKIKDSSILSQISIKPPGSTSSAV